MKAKEFIEKSKRHVTIRIFKSSEFYYRVRNSDKNWSAAYLPFTKEICLRGRQPNSTIFHELIHSVRYTDELQLVNQDIYIYEELVAHTGMTLLCQLFKTKEGVRSKQCRQAWFTYYGHLFDIDQIRRDAQKAVEKLLELVSK